MKTRKLRKLKKRGGQPTVKNTGKRSRSYESEEELEDGEITVPTYTPSTSSTTTSLSSSSTRPSTTSLASNTGVPSTGSTLLSSSSSSSSSAPIRAVMRTPSETLPDTAIHSSNNCSSNFDSFAQRLTGILTREEPNYNEALEIISNCLKRRIRDQQEYYGSNPDDPHRDAIELITNLFSAITDIKREKNPPPPLHIEFRIYTDGRGREPDTSLRNFVITNHKTKSTLFVIYAYKIIDVEKSSYNNLSGPLIDVTRPISPKRRRTGGKTLKRKKSIKH